MEYAICLCEDEITSQCWPMLNSQITWPWSTCWKLTAWISLEKGLVVLAWFTQWFQNMLNLCWNLRQTYGYNYWLVKSACKLSHVIITSPVPLSCSRTPCDAKHNTVREWHVNTRTEILNLHMSKTSQARNVSAQNCKTQPIFHVTV